MQVPNEWPSSVAEQYQPIRILGQGGFASVVLGFRKSDGVTHALKVIGKSSGGGAGAGAGRNTTTTTTSSVVTANDLAYGIREIEILAELNHVNVVKLLDHWEQNDDDDDDEDGGGGRGGGTGGGIGGGVCVLALSHAPGPTLQQLLNHGGRCSLLFARIVCAQLVDVVEYLHGRAVVHRDIKPDNMIITTTTVTVNNKKNGGGGSTTTAMNDWEQQHEIWDDDVVDISSNTITTSTSGRGRREEDGDTMTARWRELLSRWKLTLIDFGFARALTPDDVRKQPEKQQPVVVTAAGGALLEKSGRSSNFSDNSLKRSLSRHFFRTMSAVGNRSYAAPEIINGVHNNTSQHNNSKDDIHILTSSSGHFITDVTRTLSDHVAYYGLLVDSYSVGHVIRYCLTGVAPNLNVNDTIALENHAVVQLCGCLCSLLLQQQGPTGEQRSKRRRRVQYRPIGRIPPEVIRLIRGLTQPDSSKRTSMRAARLYPWVNDVLVDSDYVPPQRISYLKFAARNQPKNTLTTSTFSEGDDDEDPTESSMTI